MFPFGPERETARGRVIPPRFGDADDRMSADERTSAQVRVTFGSLRAERLGRVPILLRH